MLHNREENTRGFERETTNFMDVDDDDDDEGTALVEFSPSSTPEFSPISRWDISDFWTPNIGAGLSNMGNTYYMNSPFKCITYTVPLVEELRNCDHKIQALKKLKQRSKHTSSTVSYLSCKRQ
ncbi:uncharacterized protein LOC131035310 [Cryptomeria japonica]|uniref:uncharacterized protein LOC131035310 n=1 Tax=Cryptomeria japonica TaxID=3369 RepID=UPI0027DA4311|nr:uncharacterized protein LOC131035310 [Cryptomeria japonica]